MAMRFARILLLLFLIGAAAGTAWPKPPATEDTLSFLDGISGLTSEAKQALSQSVEDSPKADGWEAEDEKTVCVLCTVPVPQSHHASAQNSLRASARKRARLRAMTRLAIRLDGGKLNRDSFPNAEAANYALRVSYEGHIGRGLQSASGVVGETAFGLVWVNRSSLPDKPISESQVTERYCKFLYNRAQELFKAGKFEDALTVFHQIHYMEWANVRAYLGAAECFFKMKQFEDAASLASEMVQVLSSDMKPDDMAGAARILYHTGRKEEGFAVMEHAYMMNGKK